MLATVVVVEDRLGIVLRPRAHPEAVHQGGELLLPVPIEIWLPTDLPPTCLGPEVECWSHTGPCQWPGGTYIGNMYKVRCYTERY